MKNLLLKTAKRGAIVGTVAVSAVALMLTGCGEAPPAPGGSGSANPAAANFLGCIVSDRTDGKNGYIGAVFQLSAGTGLDFLHRVAPVYEHTLASRITDYIAAMTWQLG